MGSRSRDQFAELVALRSAALQRSTYLLVGDVGVAEDLVREALVRTYLAWPRLGEPREAEEFARATITTLAIGGWGADPVPEPASEPLPEPALQAGRRAPADGADERARLWRGLLRLPVRQRAAIVLRHYDGLTEGEAAAVLGAAVDADERFVDGPPGRLREVLEERAAAVRPAAPHPDEIVAEADRRVRRRRRRILAATLAAATVVAIAAAGVVAVEPRRHPAPVATGGGLADPVTWSRGETIHVGPDRVDAGVTVHGFVRTSSGFVLMDARHAVWSLTDGGRSRVGVVGDQRRLVADRSGPLAAWVGPSGDLAILDQRTGRVRRVADPGPADDGGDDGAVLALDGRTVYWRSRAGLLAVDADSGRTTSLPGSRVQLFDAKASVLAFADATRDLKVGSSLGGATPLVAWSLDPHGGDEPVVLSPTGHWIAVAHIHVADAGTPPDIDAHLDVYDVGTHAATTLELPGGPWVALPGVWLGEATLQVVGLFGDPPFSGDTVDPTLFTCTVPSGACRRVAHVGRVGRGLPVTALPDGRWASSE